MSVLGGEGRKRRIPRPGLRLEEVEFFLAWALFQGRFRATHRHDIPRRVRVALSAGRLAWGKRHTGLEFAGRLGLADHASGQFTRLVELAGMPRPSPTTRDLERTARFVAAVHAALTVLMSYPQVVRAARRETIDGPRLMRRFAKVVAAYAALSVYAARRPDEWSALVSAADLSFDRMPYVFAAAHAQIPTYLVFLDQPYTAPHTQMTAIPKATLAGCIVHDLVDADDAGVDVRTPCAVLEVPRRRRQPDPSQLHVGIVVDRGVVPSSAATVAVSAAEARNVEQVLVRPHPGDARDRWEEALSGTAANVVLAPERPIEEFVEHVDLCLVTFSGALNRLARLDVPCWFVGDAIHRPPREAGDGRPDDKTLRANWTSERFVVPNAERPFGNFLEGLTDEELASGPPPRRPPDGRPTPRARPVQPLATMLSAIERAAPWH